MDALEFIAKIDERIGRVSAMPTAPFSPEFTKWKRDCRVLLARAFGEDSSQLKDFKSIDYRSYGYVTEESIREAFASGLKRSQQILISIREEVVDFGLSKSDCIDSFATIETICRYFHSAVRQLRSRRTGRVPLDVRDEYDCQYLLFAILRIHFRDVRAEEWTPSYAGNSSRMDFLLKREQVVIEVKMTRDSLSDHDLVDQIIVDRKRYETHPDCKTLICFIYDPDGRIANPNSLRDLESGSDLKLNVLVFPQTD